MSFSDFSIHILSFQFVIAPMFLFIYYFAFSLHCKAGVLHVLKCATVGVDTFLNRILIN